tara:strand:+ start:263 stop:994 length:732 start_codon:yes stop_codon:yes gene_type:complete
MSSGNNTKKNIKKNIESTNIKKNNKNIKNIKNNNKNIKNIKNNKKNETSALEHAIILPQIIEIIPIRDRLYNSLNDFVSSININVENKPDLNKFLSIVDEKPFFLGNYTNFTSEFFTICEYLIKNNYIFVSTSNTPKQLSAEILKFEKPVHSLFTFIISYNEFMYSVREQINKQNKGVDNINYWVIYYKSDKNKEGSVAQQLIDRCTTAINGDYHLKLITCFELIITLSLAFEYEQIPCKQSI